MASQKLVETLNTQINEELKSAYIYLSMAAYFESINLKGFAHWMEIQTKEEYDHAMRIYKYLFDIAEKPVMKQIDTPPSEFASPLEAFTKAYEHEKYISSKIHDLVELAHSERDHATFNFLQWFVSEQVEEEASTLEIVEKLKMLPETSMGIFYLDRELAHREE